MPIAKLPGVDASKGESMRVLSFSDLTARGIPYSRVWIYKLMERGEFPKPTKIGARRVVWSETEIDAWLQSRFDARDGKAA